MVTVKPYYLVNYKKFNFLLKGKKYNKSEADIEIPNENNPKQTKIEM